VQGCEGILADAAVDETVVMAEAIADVVVAAEALVIGGVETEGDVHVGKGAIGEVVMIGGVGAGAKEVGGMGALGEMGVVTVVAIADDDGIVGTGIIDEVVMMDVDVTGTRWPGSGLRLVC